jgi:hypothetical protein
MSVLPHEKAQNEHEYTKSEHAAIPTDLGSVHKKQTRNAISC